METVIITGANRGIGLELTRRFLLAGKHVIAGCRAPAQATEDARRQAGRACTRRQRRSIDCGVLQTGGGANNLTLAQSGRFWTWEGKEHVW